MELYLNGDADGTPDYDANDHQYTIVRDGRLGDRGTPFTPSSRGISLATRDTGEGWELEIAVPWSELGGSGTPGRALSATVGVNDDDDGGAEDCHAIMWLRSPDGDPVHDSTQFRAFTLGP